MDIQGPGRQVWRSTASGGFEKRLGRPIMALRGFFLGETVHPGVLETVRGALIFYFLVLDHLRLLVVAPTEVRCCSRSAV